MTKSKKATRLWPVISVQMVAKWRACKSFFFYIEIVTLKKVCAQMYVVLFDSFAQSGGKIVCNCQLFIHSELVFNELSMVMRTSQDVFKNRIFKILFIVLSSLKGACVWKGSSSSIMHSSTSPFVYGYWRFWQKHWPGLSFLVSHKMRHIARLNSRQSLSRT